jgi:hypothetical protein
MWSTSLILPGKLGNILFLNLGSTGVVAIDLNQATSHPGEYILASSFNPDYSPIGNCRLAKFKTKFKNLGISDSTGSIN